MKYLKNGKECFLCHTRKRLIQVTPEEIVRQNYVINLINNYNVPKNLIECEVPMSYFGRGLKGRADIIVYEHDEKENLDYPLILVECKSPSVLLTDKVFDQACTYNEIIGAKLVILTNGIDNLFIVKDEHSEDYIEIESMPSYEDLILNKDFKVKVYTDWQRPNYINPSIDLVEEGIIGEDTAKFLYPFLTNLYGLINDENDIINNIEFDSYKFISDKGIRFTTFGNSAGGGFTGDYRYLILEDDTKDTQIVSISLMGKLSAKEHPRFGNSNGYTLLLIAIDDFEQSHLSLELSLDRFTINNNDIYEIYHDGTLTVGNMGRVKNSEVINYIETQKPKLVKNGKVYLGKLDNSYEFTWQRNDVLDFFRNIIEYALIRDDFRRLKKQQIL